MENITPQKKAVFIVVVHILSYACFLFLFRNHARMLTIGGDFFQTIAPLFPSFWLYKKYLEERSENRKFWLFLGITMLFYAIGMFVWDYYEIFLNVETPFPSLADLFWMVMYVFFLTAFIYCFLINWKTIGLVQIIYDTLIVFAAASTVSWELILKPMLQSSIDQGIWYKIVSAGYPIADLAVLFVMLCVFYLIDMKLSSKVFLFIFLGTLAILIADTLFLYLSSKGMYSNNDPVDFLWIIGNFSIGISSFYADGDVFLAKEKSSFVKTDREDWSKYFSSFPLWLPYLGVFFLFLLMMVHNNGLNAIEIGSMASILLIIFRQIFTLVENRSLVDDLSNVNKKLENQVQQRTKQLEVSLKKANFLAFHDPLTNLPNRRFFEKNLHNLLNKAKKGDLQKIAVLFLDLDRFKVINDSLGHSVGDRLLQQVVKRLQTCLKNEGSIYRQGGDEFFILLSHIDREQASKMAEKLLQALRKVFLIGSRELFITSCIGISIYPDDGKEVDVLTESADTALYAAKKTYRNKHMFYHLSMVKGIKEALDLEKDLRFALEQKEFMLLYQPIVEIKSGKMKGVEALIRWNHPIKGWMPPQRFIPIAEETGLIIPLGFWVLETACRQWKEWIDKDFCPVSIAVNISNNQFYQRNFISQIDEVLRKTGMDPAYLVLEITENIPFSNKNASEFLEELRRRGIKISIDDFGTGYSSLQYLKRMPINKLKIDQSFIKDIPNDENDVEIVQTIIAMAHNMKLEVVAEGVETKDQLEFLENHHCQFAQGFFISKPVSGKEIEARFFLKDR